VAASEGEGLASRMSDMSQADEGGDEAVHSLVQQDQSAQSTARVSQMSGTLMLGSVVASEGAEGEQELSLPHTPGPDDHE
jgi:hypothetical protein